MIDAQAISKAFTDALVGMDPRDREGYELLRAVIAEEKSRPSTGPFRFRDLTPWLRAYRFIRPRMWIIPVGAGLLVAGLMAVTYVLGRRAR